VAPSIKIRLVAWIVAVPAAFGLVAIPARRAGYLSTQRLLDVVVRHNLGRFTPLVVLALAWALVTVALIELGLATTSWWARRPTRGGGRRAAA
jgi:hypothetical protein